MTFKEGLNYIFINRKTDGEVTDPFFLYCRLSDLCSSSFADKEKVSLFYAVDKRLCLFERLLVDGNGETALKSLYAVVEELLSERKFQGLVEYVAEVVNAEKARKKSRGFWALFKRLKK